MELTGVHILLTLRCTSECDHCFVFGSPRQTATMSLEQVRQVLAQAHKLDTVRDIYFEGSEPFLFHAVLVAAAAEAASMGFAVGLVSNGYWATAPADARACLTPLAGIVSDLSLSRDRYHSEEPEDACTGHAEMAAVALGIPTAVLSIAQPEACAVGARGMLPAGETAVMFRGRAAETLAPQVAGEPWQSFDGCPHEELAAPERVHVDPSGHVHVCQGITIGNLFEVTLGDLCRRYRPADHPVIGPLLAGGPAELWRRHGLTPAARYADACHCCDAARRTLRERFPTELASPAMYGLL